MVGAARTACGGLLACRVPVLNRLCEAGDAFGGAHKLLTARHRAIYGISAIRTSRREEKAADHGICVPNNAARRIPFIVPAVSTYGGLILNRKPQHLSESKHF